MPETAHARWYRPDYLGDAEERDDIDVAAEVASLRPQCITVVCALSTPTD